MKQFPSTNIRYVYFLYVGRKLIYIGRSGKPKDRIKSHFRWLPAGSVKAFIYGPFYDLRANMIEGNEIVKRKHKKDFKGTTNQKISYDKEISLAYNGPKVVLRFGERGQEKIYVSKRSDK